MSDNSKLTERECLLLGWCYADACTTMDAGKDYRKIEFPTIVDRAIKDLGLNAPATSSGERIAELKTELRSLLPNWQEKPNE